MEAGSYLTIEYIYLNERVRNFQIEKVTPTQKWSSQGSTGRKQVYLRSTCQSTSGNPHLTQEKEKFYEELQIARQTIENVEQIMAENVREMKVKLEQENADSLNELQSIKDRLLEEQHVNEKLKEDNRNKDTVISELSLRLR